MKKIVNLIFASAGYTLLDQGIKWAVESFYHNETDLMQVKSAFHIHPVINDEVYLSVSQSAERFSMPFYAALVLYFLRASLAAVVICLLLHFISVRLFAGTKLDTSPRITVGLMYIASAITPVRTVDIIVRDGTLDYLCSSRGIILHNADGRHESIIRHHARDLTDLLLYAAIILAVLFFMKFIVSYFKYYRSKDEQKEIDRIAAANLKSIFKRK